MNVNTNLQNFYRTKQASILDYLKAMGIGVGIGGGAGAGLGVWGGSKWDDEIPVEERVKLRGDLNRLGRDDIDGSVLTGAKSLQDITANMIPRLVEQLEEEGVDPKNLIDAEKSWNWMNQNPKTTGAGLGGLGGAVLGGGGGLVVQALKDILFSGDKEAQVKRAALDEEDLIALKALIEEIDHEKRKKRKSGPKYGQRFLRGALGGGLIGAPYGAAVGGIVGGQGNESDLIAGLAGGGMAGLIGGAGLGGLANMLGGYMNEDMYDRIAEV